MKSMASFGTTQQQIFSDIGYFRGVLVAIEHIRKEHMQLSRAVLLEFNEVRTRAVQFCRIYTVLKNNRFNLSIDYAFYVVLLNM